MRSLWVDGRRLHQVGLPYHWGYKGRSKGVYVNDLLAISEEPNVRIMETKALVCNIERVEGMNDNSVKRVKNGLQFRILASSAFSAVKCF